MADRTQPRRRGYRRNYQACEACKKQKGRCDLGSPDNPQPPCTRCRRARKECVFGPSRFTSKAGATHSTSPQAPVASSSGSAAASSITSFTNAGQVGDRPWPPGRTSPGRRPSTNSVAGPTSSQTFNTPHMENATPSSSTQESSHLRDHLMNTAVTNPTDAMSLLSHTARYSNAHPVEDRPYYSTTPGKAYQDDDIYCQDLLRAQKIHMWERGGHVLRDHNPRGDDETFTTWMHLRICKDKLLGPNEALYYLNYYFERMNPINPILSEYFHDPKNHMELLKEEPILACSILAVAARHCKLPGHASWSRGTLVHNSLFRHVQAVVQRVVWGVGEEDIGLGRSLGFIQSLLLFLSWHPRALQMLSDMSEIAPPTDFEPSDSGRQFFEHNVNGIHAHVITKLSRQSNRMTWMLVGLATTLAHEVGLFEASTPDRITTLQQERYLRVKKFLILNCVEAHFRLGKASSMHQPFGLSFDVQSPNTVIELDETCRDVHHSLDCCIELARIAHMATNALYQTPAQTRTMIASKKYIGALSHFDELFQHWFRRLEGLPLKDPNPLFRIQNEMMFHNARSYIHMIGVQAIMERSLPLSVQNGRADQPRQFDAATMAATLNLPETARDLELIKVIVTGCRRTLELVIELHRMGAFKDITDSLQQHIVTTVIFALKVTGLNIEPKPDMIVLLKEVVNLIEMASIDDLSLGPIYADTLRTLIAKVENAPPARLDRFLGTAANQEGNGSTAEGSTPAADGGADNSGLSGTGTGVCPSAGESSNSASYPLAPQGSAANGCSTANAGGDDTAANFANGGAGQMSGFADAAMDGVPADWSNWLAFQFDPSFSAFETTAFMIDTTHTFT